LNKVDLPTFGRPTIATVGGFAMAVALPAFAPEGQLANPILNS
jgi:hypothetical protein